MGQRVMAIRRGAGRRDPRQAGAGASGTTGAGRRTHGKPGVAVATGTTAIKGYMPDSAGNCLRCAAAIIPGRVKTGGEPAPE